ncbi:MAG TPA: hypothetical protein VNU45_19765 [Rummeliibacillus sp.]|nr:hypothetical protein [Rummeliibacillus sp.]
MQDLSNIIRNEATKAETIGTQPISEIIKKTFNVNVDYDDILEVYYNKNIDIDNKISILEQALPTMEREWVNCKDKDFWYLLNKRWHCAASQLSILKSQRQQSEINKRSGIDDDFDIKVLNKKSNRRLGDTQKRTLLDGLKIHGLTIEVYKDVMNRIIYQIEAGFLSKNKDGTSKSIDSAIKQAITLYAKGWFR